MLLQSRLEGVVQLFNVLANLLHILLRRVPLKKLLNLRVVVGRGRTFELGLYELILELR